MTKTIKKSSQVKEKNFSFDREIWKVEYKKCLFGLQIVLDGHTDNHAHLAAKIKLWLLQLEEYPVESVELLECFSSFLCIDKTFLYNYGYFTQKITDFGKYADALRIRFEQIWLHYRLLGKACPEIVSNKLLVYDGTYCFEQKESKLNVSILPLPFAKMDRRKEDTFTLEILNNTSHVDYAHDERLGVFQLKHLLSFIVPSDKEAHEKEEKAAISEINNLAKLLNTIIGS